MIISFNLKGDIMKSSKLKIIGGVLAVLILIFAGIMSYASSKLNSEEIRKAAIEATQKVFPNATANLENVEIKWGLNFRIELKKFLLQTKDPQDSGQKPVDLAYVESLDVKIPIWAILTNGGVVEIEMNKPLVNYQEFPNTNNWVYALGDKLDKPVEETAKDSESKELSSDNPAVNLLSKSKVNVRITDVLVKYLLKNKTNGQVAVSKFLIKGLSLKDSTAFEIATTANFGMAENSTVSFDALAIGEVNIAEFLNKGEVQSQVILKINNFKKSDMKLKVPELNANFNVLAKKTGQMSGVVEASFEAHNKLKTDFNLDKKIVLSNIDVNIELRDVAAIVGLGSQIDLSKSKFTAKGGMTVLEDKSIQSDIEFALNPGVGFTTDGISTLTTAHGSFKDGLLKAESLTNVLNGSVATNFEMKVDLNNMADMSKWSPYSLKIIAQKMNISEDLIREKLWSKKPAEKTEEKSAFETKKTAASGETKLPPGTVDVQWSSILIANENFAGKGKIFTKENTVTIKDLTFNFSKGSGSLNQTLKMAKKSNTSEFTFNLSNLNLDSFKGFLPPFVENFSGTFSGKVNGQATMFKNAQTPSFDVNVNLDAKNGEIKNINLKDFVLPLIANVPVLGGMAESKDLNIDGKFDSLNLKGHFTEKNYNLANVAFISKNNVASVVGSGEIIPAGSRPSTMVVTFKENGKFGEKIKQNIGSNAIPMKLEGMGFGLKPVASYTISQVAKTAVQTKGKEALEKAIDKNLKKYIPEDAQEKVKGLFNNLLKKK